MEPEPQQPAAVMMDMPSAAAHTVSTQMNFQPLKEESKRAPFPDMGMGLSGDVEELSSTTKAAMPSPRPHSSTTAKPLSGARASPPLKQSPQPVFSAKATPAPTPHAPQPSAIGPTSQNTSMPLQQPLVAQSAQDISPDAMMGLSSTDVAATADMTGGELNFTNMEFTLAPPTDGQPQNAPPAPMQEFDMSSFTTQDAGPDLLSTDVNAVGSLANPTAADATGATPGKVAEITASTSNQDSMYDLSNLDTGNIDQMDLDLTLGEGGEANDSTFNDLFYEDTEGDMGQFNEAFFGLE
jgi:hypothetical protein